MTRDTIYLSSTRVYIKKKKRERKKGKIKQKLALILVYVKAYYRDR